jgi:FlaA1/EpsC-like NDP-sugar epimerase
MQPVGFVDDDPKKIGTVIHGLRVLGPIDAIPRMVKEFNVGEVIIAIPSASGKVIRNIVTHCQAAQVASRTIPGLYEILSGSVKVAELRKVEIEDLLRREPVRIEMDEVAQMLTGKRVLVTGAGGSIGSELCRQMLRFKPAELTLLGHGENSLFDQEINLLKVRQRVGATETEIRVVISDVRDQQRINQVFQRYQPEILFHTAAHKHVPLMEENPEEAVTNNVWGTWVVVNEALRVGVERFAFISTDKAVNPVNIMGMTKRVGELIVHQVAKESGRPYVVVRFGNVLGSRGSVVSVFQEQIAEGGPVTITHPEATRFFMTIPEAVQLVLQAATMGKGGEVFVLDMGEPVKIVDLVRDMIELSGYEVGVDMDIVYTGLRPGDKLSEELFTHSEQAGHTSHEKIWVAEGGKWLAEDSFIERVTELIELSKAGDQTQIRQKLSDLITRFEN